MSVPVVAFLSALPEGDTNFFVYNLAHMFARNGIRVLCMDYDPQAGLSGKFLNEERLAAIWEEKNPGTTVRTSLSPDYEKIYRPDPVTINDNLFLLPSEFGFDQASQIFVDRWEKIQSGSFDLYPMTVLWQLGQSAAREVHADIILSSPGYYLDAICRASLIGTNFIVTHMGTDSRSLYHLKVYGETLNDWRNTWLSRHRKTAFIPPAWNPWAAAPPPESMIPLGYLFSSPLNNGTNHIHAIGSVYRERVLNEPANCMISPFDDQLCLGDITRMAGHSFAVVSYNGQVLSHKPVFDLGSEDGICGSLAEHVRWLQEQYQEIMKKILGQMQIHGCRLSQKNAVSSPAP